MLSSLVSSLSPKQLLAGSISKSLAEFFHVNPQQVQTNLLNDARITLTGIDIKQRRQGELLVYGTVGQIEFSWAWDAGSFITDAKLTVKGVDIHVRLINDNDLVENSTGESSSSGSFESSGTTTSNVENANDSDWKTRYKQQIIDHLTLLITDVSISIQLMDQSKVVLDAKDMELHTLQQVGNGRVESSALLQEICLGSIAAWIQNADTTLHSILDPVGYHATVQRISGRRFLDGVLSGLMVQGKSWTNIDETHAPSSIRVHAGKHQLVGMNCLQKVLQKLGNDNSSSQGNERNSAEAVLPESETEVVLPSTSASSLFRLPFQSVEIVLEDDLKLALEGCEVRYCMDGTELALQCNGGFWMDGSPILQSGCMVIDFAKSKIELDENSRQEGNEVFYNAQSDILHTNEEGETGEIQTDKKAVEFLFSIDLFRRLCSSISSILPECHQAVAFVKENKESNLELPNQSSASTPWNMSARQLISFCFTGRDSTWIKVTGCGLVIEGKYPTDSALPCKFAFQWAKLESFNGLAISFPSIETTNRTVVISDRISASFASLGIFTPLQDMWDDVCGIIGSQPSREAELDYTIPGLDIHCSATNFGSVTVDKLSGTGSVAKLDSLRLGCVKGISMQARHLELSLQEGEKYLKIKEVLTCEYEGNPTISMPVQNLEFKHHQDSLSIKCDDLAMVVPYQQRDDNSKTKKTMETPILDFSQLAGFAKSLSFQAKKIKVSADAKDMLASCNMCISVTLGANAIFDASMGSLTIQSIAIGEITCRGIKASGRIDIPKKLLASMFAEPCWERFSSTRLAMESIDSLLLPDIGHLYAPIEHSIVLFDNNSATLRFNSVKFCPKLRPKVSVGIQRRSGTQGFPTLVVEVQRFVLMPEYGPGKPGLCFDQLKLLCRSQDTGVVINIACSYLQGRGPNSIEFAMKQVQSSAVQSTADGSKGKTDFCGFQKAEVSVDEISSITVPGKFRLAKPILGFTAQYKNGEVESKIVNLHVFCECARNKQVDDSSIVGDSELTTKLPTVRIIVQKGDIEWIPLDAPEQSRTRISFIYCDFRLVENDSAGKCRFKAAVQSIHCRKTDVSALVVSRCQLEMEMQRDDYKGSVQEGLSIPLLGSLQSAKLGLSEVEAFHVPNFVSLNAPSRNIEAKFSKNELVITVQDISLQRFIEATIYQKQAQASSFELPCNINVSISMLCVQDVAESKAAHRMTRCKNLRVGLEPTLAMIVTGKEASGAGFFFRCQSLEVNDSSSAVNISQLSGSGLLQNNMHDTIGNLVVGLEKAQLEADFSSIEWSGPEQRQNLKLNLPFAALPKFVLTLKCIGTLLSVQDAVIACEAFEGTSETTLDVLKAHYAGIVRQRIPYILAAKTSIAGANIGDSLGMIAGSIVTKTSIVGAAVGVASRDAVGSAVQQGKAARGADESEKYKFGDFTRGAIASVKAAAKSGAAMRNDDQYQLGDFTAGTKKAASAYASNNRMRLAGAGGSAAGMIAGAALLGPVGFVAGSFLGSSAAQASVRSVAGDHGENEESKTEESSARGSNTGDQFLDNNDQTSASLGVSSVQSAVPVVLNTEARMIGGVAMSEQRVVMAQAQILDSETPISPITLPTSGETPRYSQSNFPQPRTNATVNVVPSIGEPISDSVLEHTRYSVARTRTSMQVQASTSSSMSQYPVAPATLVAAPANTSTGIQGDAARQYQERQSSNDTGRQQRNTVAYSQSPNIQGHNIGQAATVASATATNSARRQQQQGYRFGDVTRGIVARGRQLDGREENSGYKFGDFTRGLFR